MSCDLHQRLRQARERRGLSLTTIARERGVREENLQLIERDAFEQLPTGLYGRNAVRAYALAVGMAPDAALTEVADRLREPEDPIDGLARVRGIERSRGRRAIEVAPSVLRPLQFRMSWGAPAAAVVDSLILIAIDAAVVMLTAAVARVRPADVLQLAAPALLVVFALIAVVYFVLLGGIRRATFGAQLMQAEALTYFNTATLHAVMQRGLKAALSGGSSLFAWLLLR
jgi:hypothetical protein